MHECNGTLFSISTVARNAVYNAFVCLFNTCQMWGAPIYLFSSNVFHMLAGKSPAIPDRKVNEKEKRNTIASPFAFLSVSFLFSSSPESVFFFFFFCREKAAVALSLFCSDSITIRHLGGVRLGYLPGRASFQKKIKFFK